MIAVTFALGATTTVLGYICSGLGSGMVSMLGTGLRQFLSLVPLAYLLGKLGGVGAIWYSMWISEALAVLYVVFASRRLLRAKDI